MLPLQGGTAGTAGLQSSIAQQGCLRAAHLPRRARDWAVSGFLKLSTVDVVDYIIPSVGASYAPYSVCGIPGQMPVATPPQVVTIGNSANTAQCLLMEKLLPADTHWTIRTGTEAVTRPPVSPSLSSRMTSAESDCHCKPNQAGP